MELKKIEITGFKSFPEKTVIEFDRGITAIVGPNGSGKSNIADAVRWVLGEQNARMLRGSKMEDIIFSGTMRRKSLNYAQVTLVLDNKDRGLNLDYEEVAVSRTLYRSGESEYTINGSRCRLKDVQELFMDTGIGKEGYSIIGQGQVERILNGKPQERRALFEEAAGVVKFKARKNEAQSRLNDKDEALVRVDDVLRELSERRAVLEEEAVVATEYLGYKDELKAYEVTLFLNQYSQFQDQLQKANANLADIEAQLADERLKFSCAEDNTTLAKEKMTAAQEAFKEADALRQELAISVTRIEGNIRALQIRGENAEREKNNLEKALSEAKRRLRTKMDVMNAEKEKTEALKAQKENAADEKEALSAKLSECDEDIRTAQNQYEEADDAVEACKQELNALLSARERYAALVEHAEAAFAEWLGQKDELEKKLAEAGALKAEKQAAVDEAAAAYAETGSRIASLNDELNELRAKVKDGQEKLQAAGEALRDVQNRKKWLKDLENDYEGFSNSVRTVMNWKKTGAAEARGVVGTVSDLVEVPSQYAVAIEIAFGGALQNIVAEDRAVAKALIEKLRREQKGRVTFLPLDLVKNRDAHASNDGALKMPGILGYASDLIRYDSRYQSVISRLIGNVVVAESFDAAAAVAEQYGAYLRAVTLKGDIFNIGGAITGGSVMQSGNILSRKSELEEVLNKEEKAQSEVRRISAELSAVTEERKALSETLTEANARLETEREALDSARGALQEAGFAVAQVQQKITEGEENARILNQSKEEQQTNLNAFDTDKVAAEKKVAEAEAVRLEAERQRTEAQAARQTAHDNLLTFNIGQSGIDQKIALLEETLEREEGELELISAECDSYLDQLEVLRNRPQDDEAELTAETLALEKAKADLDTQKEISAQREEEEKQFVSAWETSNSTQNEIAANVHNLEKEKLRLDAQQARANNDLVVINERLWEDYQLTYNVALSIKRDDLGSQTQMKRRVAELKEAIAALGPVNEKAVAELEAVKERHGQLKTQRDDIEAAAEEIRGVIDDLQKKISAQFAEGFKQISAKFEETFAAMFGGGHALLQLTAVEEEDEEAGVEIIAQPPGKKLQSMSLLSGGERALTAIALLFAVQQLNPAPFCILDEIEAALDDVNIARFAAYLEELCKDTQFILITHRKGTMQAAQTLYGVTMEEKGVSKCVSVKFK